MAERTPLYSLLLREAEKQNLRMHLPGHKGRRPGYFGRTDLFALDMTELAQTGNLYEGLPPIRDAEALMAGAAGAAHCFFLTGGSTQGIMAAMAAACPPGSRVLVDRGCHRSVWNAMAHLDLLPAYLYPERLEPWGVSGSIPPGAVGTALDQTPDAAAVILTSPTYYGVLTDIPSIAELAARRRVPLLVDEAHGAHLPFLNGYRGAVAQGASLAVASAHKTLPALTAGAMIYAAADWDPREIRRCAALFGTTSPSYLVMASMDLARAFLEEEGGAQYARTAAAVAALRREINGRGVFRALEDAPGTPLDPTRLTVCTAAGGIPGDAAAKLLEENLGVVCECSDARNIVCILTCADTDGDIARLREALRALEPASRPAESGLNPISPPRPRSRLTPREAVYAPRMFVPLREAAGKIAAEHLSPYPPGIPVVAAGEEISPAHLDYLLLLRFDPDREIAVVK